MAESNPNKDDNLPEDIQQPEPAAQNEEASPKVAKRVKVFNAVEDLFLMDSDSNDSVDFDLQTKSKSYRNLPKRPKLQENDEEDEDEKKEDKDEDKNKDEKKDKDDDKEDEDGNKDGDKDGNKDEDRDRNEDGDKDGNKDENKYEDKHENKDGDEDGGKHGNKEGEKDEDKDECKEGEKDGKKVEDKEAEIDGKKVGGKEGDKDGNSEKDKDARDDNGDKEDVERAIGENELDKDFFSAIDSDTMDFEDILNADNHNLIESLPGEKFKLDMKNFLPATYSAQAGKSDESNFSSIYEETHSQIPSREKRPYRRRRKLLIRRPKGDLHKLYNKRKLASLTMPSEIIEKKQPLPPRNGMIFEIGARLKAQDNFGKWYPSKILEIHGEEILIHFERWSHRFDEWVSIYSPRLRAIEDSAPSRKCAKKSHYYENLLYMLGDEVLVKDTEDKLHLCQIVDLTMPGYISVKYNTTDYIRQVPEGEIIQIQQDDKEKLLAEASLHNVTQKALMIEEDHNQFKCNICTKSFRKESLLHSHLKHYHLVGRQKLSTMNIRHVKFSSSPTQPLQETLFSTTLKSSSYLKEEVPSTSEHLDSCFKDNPESKEVQPKEDVIRCCCNSNVDYGLMIQCESCLAWQHAECVNINKEKSVPKHYLCYLCAPSPPLPKPVSDIPAMAHSSHPCDAPDATITTSSKKAAPPPPEPKDGLAWYSGYLPKFAHVKSHQRNGPTPADVIYINKLVGCAEESMEVLATLRHRINLLKSGAAPEDRPQLQHSILQLYKAIDQRTTLIEKHFKHYTKGMDKSFTDFKMAPLTNIIRCIKLILRYTRSN